MNNDFIILGLMSLCGSAFAQAGPTLPCPDCAINTVKPTPYEGAWFNPEQSGSGFLFQVQNDRLLGFYFGYDEDGDDDWALFSGQLQDASEDGALWRVTAPLEQFSGGACLNCPHQVPTQNIDMGSIEVVFNRLAHASFSVNGGAVQNIVPLYFGFPFESYFSEQTSFATPELEGWWSIFIDAASSDNAPEPYTFTNFLVHVSLGRFDNEGRLGFNANYYPTPPELVRIGSIDCFLKEVNMNTQPTCEFSIAILSIEFNIDLANISSDRIYGESENGDVLEMIRLSADYCPSPSTPENCINTGIFDYLND
ncbi:hypothetical protein [Marinicella meishanensis]|uniref:hypothetical protein n=1 Tax=Marinicella meishanensis TaxID=2873263 RepID=UPI001CC11F17|nr:hypothetical protein [Marinicella sp. NBU2979]